MRRRALVALTACLLVLAGCGSSSSSPSSSGGTSSGQVKRTRSIEVMLDWVPNPDHLALYTSLAEGYFRARGLDVTLQPPSNVDDVAKLVAAGEVPLGISYEPDTIIAGASGLPITAVGALVPVALNSIIAPAKSGITTPAGLEGKSVGVSGLPSDDAFLEAIALKAGIPLSSVHKVNVGASLLPSVVSGKVDAILGGYRNVEAIQVRDLGLKPTVIPITDAGVPQYDELVIIANSAKLKTDPGYQQTVRQFLAALAQGNAVALAHPSTAAASMHSVVKGYPADQLAQMIATTAPLLANRLGFGQMNAGAWQSFADWMHANRLIDKSVNISTVMTDKYLPSR